MVKIAKTNVSLQALCPHVRKIFLVVDLTIVKHEAVAQTSKGMCMYVYVNALHGMCARTRSHTRARTLQTNFF